VDVPFALRVPLDPTSEASRQSVESTAALLKPTQGRLWIVVGAPQTPEAAVPWQMALRAWLRAHASAIGLLELGIEGTPRPVAALAVRMAATELRAAADGVPLAVAVPTWTSLPRRVLPRPLPP
jgi:hypothetical protein